MITVSAKALWWRDAEHVGIDVVDAGWADPMYVGMIDGAQYLTDQYTLLPLSRVDLPVNYSAVFNLRPLPGQALDGIAEWLSRRPLPDASARLFAASVIDPLEQAGFLIRPLEGVKDAHGVCDPDLTLAGLVIPLRRSVIADPATGARVAA